MTRDSVTVTTPSRLHFGLLSFGRDGQRQFGGVGAMVCLPGLRIHVSTAVGIESCGPLASRAAELTARALAAIAPDMRLGCRVEILQAPPEHVGLGTGTQLALAVASGICALFDLSPRDPPRLAKLMGRGARSAVGTHGFASGGLIAEDGKLDAADVSPLRARIEMPVEWRMVLMRPEGEFGLSGELERDVFAALPPVPSETTAALRDEMTKQLLPAAAEQDFDRFSESLYRFGVAAGQCFAECQGGVYASERVARLIDMARSLGVRGVGQSSWGPTTYALLADPDAVERFTALMRAKTDGEKLDFLITPFDNQGARIES